MQKLGLGRMHDWARLWYLPMSVQAGVGHVRLGQSTYHNARELDLGAVYVGELWTHFCGTIVPDSLLRELGVVMG